MGQRRSSPRRRSCLPPTSWLPASAIAPVVERLRGTCRARRTTVEPAAQLSLMPELVPGRPPEVIVGLPEAGVAAAIRILARLIAHAAATRMAEAGDE